MKKNISVMISLVLILTLVFATGCGGGNESSEETYNSDWKGAIEQSEGVQVETAVDHQVLAFYSEESEIESFLNALAMDQWVEVKEPPTDAKFEYSVSFFKFGTLGTDENAVDSNDESDNSGSQTVVARIKTYSDSDIIVLESLGLSLTFKMPQSGLDAIRKG